METLSCGTGSATGIATFTPTNDLDVSWEWDLRDAGGISAGSRITYHWLFTGAGRTFVTDEQTLIFEDPRFEWRTITGEHTRLMWYAGDADFAKDLLDIADAGIRQFQATTGVLPQNLVEVGIYETAEAMRETVLFSPEWADGIAYPAHGLVAMGINRFSLSWGRDAMVHEMTHVVMGQSTFRCGSSLPAWFDEGLAVFNEGSVAGSFTTAHNQAIEDDTAFADRGTIDRALQQAYGFDTDGLDAVCAPSWSCPRAQDQRPSSPRYSPPSRPWACPSDKPTRPPPREQWRPRTVNNTDLSSHPVHDPDAALALLRDSTYAADLANGTFPEVIFTTSGFGGVPADIQFMIAQWSNHFLIDVKVRSLSPDTYYSALADEVDNLFGYGWIADYPDPQNFLDVLLHSTSVDNNIGGYSNAAYDRLLEQARSETNHDQRMALYQQAEQILMDDAGIIPFFHAPDYVLTKPHVQGFAIGPLGIPLLQNVTIAPRE